MRAVIQVVKQAKLVETSKTLDKMKDLGFYYSTLAGITVSAFDVTGVHNKQEILAEADEKVTKFIKSHASQMEVLVKALLEKETLYRQDVDNLLSKKNNNNKK